MQFPGHRVSGGPDHHLLFAVGLEPPIRRKQWLMTSIALLEVLVLSLAAWDLSSPAAIKKRLLSPGGVKRRFYLVMDEKSPPRRKNLFLPGDKIRL